MKKAKAYLLITGLLFLSIHVFSQANVTLPPNGANQKAEVSQWMGLVKVTINYSSPDVTAPDGTNRKGKIWGQLVPFGMTNLGFGTAKEGPWRAGANEGTIFSVSHDVMIEGKKLPAGDYGLHMIAQPEGKSWTIIFSHNSTAWGSFYYDPAEDALRVEVQPVENDYQEWLTYEFEDRQPASCLASLQWENLKVPFKIEVENINELYFQNMKRELQSVAGFSWQGFTTAATFCVQNNFHLDQALVWADAAISMPFVGQENANTLMNKSNVLNAMEKKEEAQKYQEKAVYHPTAQPGMLHNYGRQLITQGNPEKALEIFELNGKRNPEIWFIGVGMARAYSAMGKYKKALKHMEDALAKAPTEFNKNNVKGHIEKLKKGEDIN
jgi:tetratricopeptide (TPR) repeat protein